MLELAALEALVLEAALLKAAMFVPALFVADALAVDGTTTVLPSRRKPVPSGKNDLSSTVLSDR